MDNASAPAVFVDRDGTIIHDADYLSDPKQVKIFPGVTEALRRLKSKRFKLIIITNQSGIGRGLFTVDQYRAVEEEVLRQLEIPYRLNQMCTGDLSFVAAKKIDLEAWAPGCGEWLPERARTSAAPPLRCDNCRAYD